MEEDKKEFCWVTKLDWLNILSMLNLERINQIPEFKKEKAIRKITKMHSTEALLEFEPSYLDKLVVNELKELMKKELIQNERKQREAEKDLREKIIPFKQGGIIKLDPRDLPKDFNGDPKELIKYFKKIFGDDDDDNNDDDKDRYKEDNTRYYI
ncbi:MAG: hypothetical protein JSV62_06810 [Promethearchaeota archaeon]|nr:MAG: hypothetical protein JSV62_06810 [Candidatus Lokiarchaeota archaeon]